MKLVLFRVGDREFGANIIQIREVIRIVDPVPIPESPPWVEGVIDMRGEVIPVINLKRKLGLSGECLGPSSNRVLIADAPGHSFGVAVEHVTSVIKLERSALSGAGPMFEEVGYITGVAHVDGVLVPIMDLFLMADLEGRPAHVASARLVSLD